jgi:hypothetical protein
VPVVRHLARFAALRAGIDRSRFRNHSRKKLRRKFRGVETALDVTDSGDDLRRGGFAAPR